MTTDIDDTNPINHDLREGRLFYSPVGTGQTNPLIGPAHVLLVDFMVTEKFLGKIIKDLNLKEIKFDEVAGLLHTIQDKILELKGRILKDDGTSRSEYISTAKQEINAVLAKVKNIAIDFTDKLKKAESSAANDENKLLIKGAINSITNQMQALQKDVDKTFAKLEPKLESKAKTSSPKIQPP